MSNYWEETERRRLRSQDGYDQMQVCLNGHQITDAAIRYPEHKKAFCPDCGARTIDTCEKCSKPIPGEFHVSGSIIVGFTTPVPKYCASCGEPFPWQEAAMENAIEVIRETGLADQDVQAIEAALSDIVRDTPKTQSASMRVTRLLSSLRKPAYDLTIGVITDIASETAKKTLGLK